MKRSVQRTARNVVASTVRLLSDTSRIHVMVVQGDVVFDALCQLEEHDFSGMQKAMRICDDFSQDIPVRRRVLGEYAVTLVVVEWPLHPSPKTTSKLVDTLQSILTKAVDDERSVDGITLVAEECAISKNRSFRLCFLETFQALERIGYHPLAILQQCDELSRTLSFPFDTTCYRGNFLTHQALHGLLAKKIYPA